MIINNQAIEVVCNVENSNDLLLCGIEGVQHANHNFSSAHYYKNIGPHNSVSNIFGLGENNKFFYTLMSFRDNQVVRYESGTGYGYESENKHYFKRYFPVYEGKNLDHIKYINNPQQSRFECDKEYTNILISSVPENYSHLLFDKNCVVVSKYATMPFAVQVHENSFLARVDDNDISSLSFDSKTFSDIIAEAVTKYTKQIALKCSKLNANKLAIKQLQLENNDGSGAKAGTLIYDGETDTIKFYNGTKWRTLKWEDEEKAE